MLAKRGPPREDSHSAGLVRASPERDVPHGDTGIGRAALVGTGLAVRVGGANLNGAHPVPLLHIDFETRSTVNLLQSGVYPYALHPTTSVTLARYRFTTGDEDGPILAWSFRDPACPDDIRAHVEAGHPIICHNAAFERVMWWSLLCLRHGWPKPRLESFHCTAAQAAALSLPRALGEVCAVLNLADQKDEAGRRLMLKMAKPMAMKGPEPVWYEPPEAFRDLGAYCEDDVRAECGLHRRVLPLGPGEQDAYWLDQRINDRGVMLDRHAAERALELVDGELRRLHNLMFRATTFQVDTAHQVQLLLAFTNLWDDEIVSLAKKPLAVALASPKLPQLVRDCLQLRSQAAKASTAKLRAMLRSVCPDGRLRGTLLFCGAGTGRWAGRLWQPQNLPRPQLVRKPEAIEKALAAVVAHDLSGVRTFGPPLQIVSDLLRAMIVAAPGHDLIAADYANIEGREAAWLAGQDDKLQAFRRYDAELGPDLYCVAAEAIFGEPVDAERDPDRRQVGKVAELALGYQGGVRAFVAMSAAYPGSDMAIINQYERLWSTADAETREIVDGNARRLLEQGPELPLGFVRASDIIKRRWRAAHPRIVRCWYDLEDAAIEAVQNRGRIVFCGRLAFRFHLGFLWMRLPSGRSLAYCNPEIVEAKTPWGETKPALVAWGVSSRTRKWAREVYYGGKLFENAVQAIARDVMLAGMWRVEDAGYPVVLTVHDEILSEIRQLFGDLSEYERLLSTPPAWNAGCPIVAKGWRGRRYRKA